ncbi:MAG: 30S ribosomal protein S3 [Acidobacteriia bacterium]|nr:30S ribosomal protein S3 [Terriglobia bacterium]MYC66684.1 30S ribosomal protein S3 [Terriglobia bacterium]
MGQKVHPYGFRLGYTKVWRSRWYAQKGYADLVNEDIELKAMLRKRLKAAGISSIELDRPGNRLRIAIRAARPGIIIGKKGSEIEKLKAELQQQTKRDIYIDIQEVHRPELDAQLVAESVAVQIEKRVSFRRAMRKSVEFAQRFGCKGIKIWVAGRLNGKMIARSEWHLHGRLPLQTLRADIDYGFSEANTTYGVLGVKCWIYKGEIIDPRGAAIRKTGREDPEPARRREARSQAEQERERLRRPAVAAAEEAVEAAAPVEAPPEAPVSPPAESAFQPPMADTAGTGASEEEE